MCDECLLTHRQTSGWTLICGVDLHEQWPSYLTVNKTDLESCLLLSWVNVQILHFSTGELCSVYRKTSEGPKFKSHYVNKVEKCKLNYKTTVLQMLLQMNHLFMHCVLGFTKTSRYV